MKWIFTSNVADHSLDIVEYERGFIHRFEDKSAAISPNASAEQLHGNHHQHSCVFENKPDWQRDSHVSA